MEHICTPDTCPEPGFYYVSMTNGLHAPDVRALLGPFPTHALALDYVEQGRRCADELDVKAHWYGFGTVRLASSDGVVAILQDRFPELAMTTFEADDLVELRAETKDIPIGTQGRIVETFTGSYHRVVFPALQRTVYVLGTALRKCGALG